MIPIFYISEKKYITNMAILHYYLILLLLFNTIYLFFITNPIFAMLALILIFCESTLILFLFGLDFLGFLLIIIYIGAIAIFFLFFVMLSPEQDFKPARGYGFFIVYIFNFLFSLIIYFFESYIPPLILLKQTFLFKESTFFFIRNRHDISF